MKDEGSTVRAVRCSLFILHPSSFILVLQMLSQVVELIESKRRFAITSHIRPDGDSLGSSLGLYWLLRALDKDVEVIMRDPVPHAYRQLPGADDGSRNPSSRSALTTRYSSSNVPTLRVRV